MTKSRRRKWCKLVKQRNEIIDNPFKWYFKKDKLEKIHKLLDYIEMKEFEKKD